MRYRVRLIDTGNGYAVWVPALPGCRSFGRTEGEALENIRGAILSYLEALEEQNTAFDSREIEIF
ncbi:MAG: type II toxin-antitoxin system HicB family antitoxin [Candidatus Aminicenantes bacterium]|nr:type II toxin-antitoxin system HicB family antitoxin [Candidatus Aminicenantes bacterium]